MKKENKKLAQELKAKKRARDKKIKTLKNVAMFGTPILLGAAFIGLLVYVGVNENDKKGNTTGSNTQINNEISTEPTTTVPTPILNKEEGLEVTDGVTVNIDYTGYIDGEKFEGGSTEGYGPQDLTIGSNSYIDGFEDGLIGHKVGETVELNLRFPDEYHNENYAGKDVVFEVTINGIYE